MGNVTSQQVKFDNSCPLRCETSIAVLPPINKRPSCNNDADSLFTAEEKQLIRKTWSQLQQQPIVNNVTGMVDGNHNVNRGVRVFLRIFQLEPEAQSVFSEFQHVAQLSELVANPLFRSHAKRFMTAVDMTVRSLDALDVIVAPTLVRLGRRHVQFAGFHPRYMAVFERAMDSAWRTDLGRRRYSGATRRAWRKLFRFLTSSVTDGYDEALREAAAATDSRNVDTASLHQQPASIGHVTSVQEN